MRVPLRRLACDDAVVNGTLVPPASSSSVRTSASWSDPRTPLILLPLAVLFGLLAELSLANADVEPDAILTDAASGYAYLLAGLTAWYRRPGNRSGPLMLGIGLAWFGGDFLFSPVPLLGPASFAAQAAARILFAWLLLAFPAGRLESNLHRLAVAAIGWMAATFAVLQLVTVDPATICACPESPFAVTADSALASQVPGVGAALGIAMTLILVPLVVRRAVLASGPLRRTLIPVLAGGAFSLLSVLPDVLVRLGNTEAQPISWLPIVWVGLPIGFLVALLRERMARGAVADLVIRLGSTPEPQHLRDALAHALGDPRLELLAWSADEETYVAADGTRTRLPASLGRIAPSRCSRTTGDGSGPSFMTRICSTIRVSWPRSWRQPGWLSRTSCFTRRSRRSWPRSRRRARES